MVNSSRAVLSLFQSLLECVSIADDENMRNAACAFRIYSLLTKQRNISQILAVEKSTGESYAGESKLAASANDCWQEGVAGSTSCEQIAFEQHRLSDEEHNCEDDCGVRAIHNVCFSKRCSSPLYGIGSNQVASDKQAIKMITSYPWHWAESSCE
nr:uncharacterized protein LOC112276525 [Physcomitrium patens]|eukprot:XP_024363684.1 uncharacterized protein LOC112276525 [Physcomitrella patens]